MARNLIKSTLQRSNTKRAKALWPAHCTNDSLKILRELTTTFGFSVELGEITVIDGRWYVTHSGLLRLAARRHCKSINVEPVLQFSNPAINRWVFKCNVQKYRRSRGFVGFGDAEPSNVSPRVRGAEMRIAETRAVNRALRKAYGIGLCSVEELGSASFRPEQTDTKPHRFPVSNANGNGHSNVRDRLCLLIRKYDLDPARVKKYAADYCGTETLRDAGRDLVESFVNKLEEQAANDRAALFCKLNSYATEQEVHS
jgi:hypothetical protein